MQLTMPSRKSPVGKGERKQCESSRPWLKSPKALLAFYSALNNFTAQDAVGISLGRSSSSLSCSSCDTHQAAPRFDPG